MLDFYFFLTFILIMKRKGKLVSFSSLIQAFTPTRSIYKKVSSVTAPFRITGIRPTLRGFTFRKARLSKTGEIPTLGFIKQIAGKLVSRQEEKKEEKKD
jgi:hypothetical protein